MSDKISPLDELHGLLGLCLVSEVSVSDLLSILNHATHIESIGDLDAAVSAFVALRDASGKHG